MNLMLVLVSCFHLLNGQVGISEKQAPACEWGQMKCFTGNLPYLQSSSSNRSRQAHTGVAVHEMAFHGLTIEVSHLF